MPVFESVRDPSVRTYADLLRSPEVWRVHLDEDDIRAHAGPDWSDLRVIVTGEVPRDAQDPPVSGVRKSPAPGVSQLDIVAVEARLAGHGAVLRWEWNPGSGRRLDLLHIEGMRAADVERLLRARRYVEIAWQSVGRPLGTVLWSREEFEARLRNVVEAKRRSSGSFTHEAVAMSIGISSTTLRSFLKRSGIDWRTVQNGDWPPG